MSSNKETHYDLEEVYQTNSSPETQDKFLLTISHP